MTFHPDAAERRHDLDNLRWGTVALVVIYHVIYLFNGEAAAGVAGPFSPVQYQDAVQYLLYPWFMALLFLVAGISANLALGSMAEKDFLRSRTRKLLVPSTLGLLVFQWIQGVINIRLGGTLEFFSGLPPVVRWLIFALSGTGVLWFIQMLWVFSVLLIPLRRLERGRLSAVCANAAYSPLFMALLVIPVWASAQVLNTPIIAVYRFGIYSFVFLLGYYVFSTDSAMACLARWWPLFAAAAVPLGILSVVRYFGQNYAVPPVVNSPLSVSYLWCVCLALLGGMYRHGNRTGRFCRFMVRNSWGLYLFHYLPLSLCGLLLTQYTHLPPAVIYLLCAAAAFGGALALSAIISRIPVLRWCVMGIRVSKKEQNYHV